MPRCSPTTLLTVPLILGMISWSDASAQKAAIKLTLTYSGFEEVLAR